jgi:ATP-binding cassette subfamily C protein
LAEGLALASLLPLLGHLTGNAANLPPPLDRVFEAVFGWLGVSPSIEVFLVLMVALTVMRVAITFIVMVFIGRMTSVVAADLRSRLITAFAQARWSYFTSQPVGRPAHALSSETARAAQGLTTLCEILAATAQVVVLASFAFLISWEATALALLVALINTVSLRWLIERIRGINRRSTQIASAMATRLIDGLNNIKAIKAMGAERRLKKLLTRDINALRWNGTLNILLSKLVDSLQELIKLAAVIVLFLFMWSVTADGLERVFVVLIMFMRMVQNLNRIQKFYRTLVNCEAPFDHVRELILHTEQSCESATGAKLPSVKHELRLRDVCFGYDKVRILSDVNLAIPAGSFICLTGPSGAGKTTILDLVCGLLRPQNGEILLDGVPLAEIDVRLWRRQIGYVPQELTLFHDTIYANVTLGDDRISEIEVEESLRAAEAWSFVCALPEGMHTVVGERGTRFSGGQRQRIAMARALVRRPQLLILDEVTSSLDPKTEEEICASLSRLRSDVTILAASHRTSLTNIADEVYLVNGHSAERISSSPARTPVQPAI